MDMSAPIGLADVEEAAERIRPWIRRTPVVEVDDSLTGLMDPVLLKLDLLQRTGSFKARGAFNTLLQERPERVIAASGGNHGAAVAYAARRLGIDATIVVPETTPAVKVERLRSYGATVRQIGREYAVAFEEALRLRDETGARMVHAYDEPLVVAGQGTAALEFVEQADEFGELDTVIVAVGGGGLIGGTIAALAGRGIRVVAVESSGTPTLVSALHAGEPVEIDVSGLAADSLGARRIGDIGFALAKKHLHAMVVVDDDAIREARRRLWADLRIVAEPGGAAALAALISGRYRPHSGERIGVIVCGGNTDPGSL